LKFLSFLVLILSFVGLLATGLFVLSVWFWSLLDVVTVSLSFSFFVDLLVFSVASLIGKKVFVWDENEEHEWEQDLGPYEVKTREPSAPSVRRR
jgi:hypothetical protein